MALRDKVYERYDLQTLTSLTNRNNRNTTSILTVDLDVAAKDVEADFKIYAGLDFDETVDTHVTVAVECVVSKLIARSPQGFSRAQVLEDRCIERMQALALVTSQDKITPTTKSEIQPTREKQSGIKLLPEFDFTRFKGVTPNAPRRI